MQKGNLVLLLDRDEEVSIGEDVSIMLMFRQGRKTRVRITAPTNLKISRRERNVKEPECNGNR